MLPSPSNFTVCGFDTFCSVQHFIPSDGWLYVTNAADFVPMRGHGALPYLFHLLSRPVSTAGSSISGSERLIVTAMHAVGRLLTARLRRGSPVAASPQGQQPVGSLQARQEEACYSTDDMVTESEARQQQRVFTPRDVLPRYTDHERRSAWGRSHMRRRSASERKASAQSAAGQRC